MHREHISGAEGLYEDREISGAIRGYLRRALNHPRGYPDEVVITVENVQERPLRIPLLRPLTLECRGPDEAEGIIVKTLSGLGVSKNAVQRAMMLLKSPRTMRGASLMLMKSGRRREPDTSRGIRVSRLGIERSSLRALASTLSRSGINTIVVREALILASKVASHPGIVAEVCIPDNPDYTTGYLASATLGYLRVPSIKNYHDMHGGRVFFIREDADVEQLIHYLERTPVIMFLDKGRRGK